MYTKEIFLASLVLLFQILLIRAWRIPKHAYPPGPPPFPLLGNLFQFPTSRWWLRFTELGQKYGPLVHLSVASKHVVLISSQEVAAELLEKTGCADRPHFPMVGEMMGFDASIAFIEYGDRWRAYRRLSHKAMSIKAVNTYENMLEKESIRLLASITQDAHSIREQIRFSLGRTIMEAIYGIECTTPNDTYIEVAEATLKNITHGVIPGSYMVDIIPWLKFFPYIGLPFQRDVRTGKKQMKLMVERPFQHVLRERANGTAKASFTSLVLDSEVHTTDHFDWEDTVAWAAATMYGAAGDTMHSSLLTFILSMAQNQSVQIKAQAELDVVVGRLRPPHFSDRESLPYVNAVVKEVLRWRVALPLGVPHVCREDTTYKGYFLPKGTILIANAWSISQDSKYYKAPQTFMPERFLGESPELDPFTFAFGYGPRICVGKHFAINQLFILVASLLWAFEISPYPDVDLSEVPYTSGFISTAAPFACKIIARHSGVKDLVSQTYV